MRKPTALVTLVGYAVASLLMFAPAAHADSFSTAAGMQSGTGYQCFQFYSIWPGANHDSASGECFGQQWVMPLYWRNFYWSWTNRTVTVRARTDELSLLGCTLYVYNANGQIVSQASTTFPSSDEYTSRDLTVNNVTSGSSAVVTCSMIGGTTYVMKVDYDP